MPKTVLVTGSSRGIGNAIIRLFAKNGYNVIINYLHSKEEAFKLQTEIESLYNVKTLVIKADVSNEEDVKNMLKESLEAFSSIDILVNNAGISIDSTLEDKTVDSFKRILDVNLIGTFLMCKYFGADMFNKKSGSIINISSNCGIDSYYPYGMDYDASKAGVINLTHNFAIQYAPYIRVNSIAPGWVNTEMNKELDGEYIEEECSKILLNRFAEPNEIAETVYFVANSTYINDSIIKVDGGKRQ